MTDTKADKVMASHQVAEMRPDNLVASDVARSSYWLRWLCDSHELLRARLAEAERERDRLAVVVSAALDVDASRKPLPYGRHAVSSQAMSYLAVALREAGMLEEAK